MKRRKRVRKSQAIPRRPTLAQARAALKSVRIRQNAGEQVVQEFDRAVKIVKRYKAQHGSFYGSFKNV